MWNGKVGKAHHRASCAPLPATDDGINKSGQEQSEDEERPKLHALGNGAGHNRRGGGAEHHLEVPVRTGCIAA